MMCAVARTGTETETEPVQEAQPLRSGEPFLSSPPTCPDCHSAHVHRHGFYNRRDGSRPPRFRCQACGKSFSHSTGTSLAYTKKRSEFKQFVETMGAGFPLRRHAAELGIHLSTAFRWRHRHLSVVASQPQPKLAGEVVMGEAYVGFSQKGQRVKPQHARRFVQRQPSRILLFVGSSGQRMAMVGSAVHHMAEATCPGDGTAVASHPEQPTDLLGAGRPGTGRKAVAQRRTSLLQACLKEALAPDAEVHVKGLPAFADICRKVGLTVCDGTLHPPSEAERIRTLTARVGRMRASFYGWLVRFFGVATRYLHHYLAWYGTLLRTDDGASA